MATVAELVRQLDAWCPPDWAEDWDNVGLLCGDGQAEVHRCLCALDPDGPTLELAAQLRTELVVTHHPLPLRPVRRLRPDEPGAAALWRAARLGLALYAAHTNLDVHPQGVSAALAEALGLRAVQPLRVKGHEVLYKLVVFVPRGYEDRLRAALAEAGAGHIGAYSHCSFRTEGEGTFLPLEGAKPFVGSRGTLQRQPESRLEMLVPERALARALAAMRAVHPYEEVAYDVLRLENPGPTRGLGCVGELAPAQPLGAWVRHVARVLGAPATRFVGDPERAVRRVALCGGAGGSLWPEARRAGAEVLLTADVGYHQALEAAEAGLAVVDAGHRATEAPAVPVLAAAVRQAVAALGAAVEVAVAPQRPDPWQPAGVEGVH